MWEHACEIKIWNISYEYCLAVRIMELNHISACALQFYQQKYIADTLGYVGLMPLVCWDRRFESR